MTNETVLENLELIPRMLCKHWVDETCRIASEAIQKQEDYKWHDLRKNPQDLPEEGIRVLVQLEWKGWGRECYVDCHMQTIGWTSDKLPYSGGVIRWKHIDIEEEEE